MLTHLAVFHLKIAARFNTKLQLGITGRQQTFELLKSKINTTDHVVWMHCASLGEFEQGLPVLETLKKEFPHYKIVLSFFSPSGYEVKKNTPIADVVVYLPFDTKADATTFIELAHPKLAIFVKYEIWPHYLRVLKERAIQTILISALFRKQQIFFKPYGRFMKRALYTFNHIFTQDKASKDLLNHYTISNVSVAGDTRFDRVINQLAIDNTLDFITEFKGDSICIVAGSTWPEDEKLLIPYINASNDNAKFIIAPHNIKPQLIKNLQKQLKKPTALFSEKDTSDLKNSSVFILDTIGVLSKVYHYADIAYVGGAMGHTGLHNTLEAAVFGVPIVIGKNHKEFPEASAMISKKGLLTISNQKELNTAFNKLLKDAAFRKESGQNNAQYIYENKGAVIQIMEYLRTYL